MLFLDSLDRTLNKNTNNERKERKKNHEIELKCRESEGNSLWHAHSSITLVYRYDFRQLIEIAPSLSVYEFFAYRRIREKRTMHHY